MNYIISQNVPICPECSALMVKRETKEVYYHCLDCMKILQVIGNGKAEVELIVTDGASNEETI